MEALSLRWSVCKKPLYVTALSENRGFRKINTSRRKHFLAWNFRDVLRMMTLIYRKIFRCTSIIHRKELWLKFGTFLDLKFEKIRLFLFHFDSLNRKFPRHQVHLGYRNIYIQTRSWILPYKNHQTILVTPWCRNSFQKMKFLFKSMNKYDRIIHCSYGH